MNTHAYKTHSPGRCFSDPFMSEYIAGTDCKCMAAQYVRETGDKKPFRRSSLLRPNLTAGCLAPALIPLHCYFHHFRPSGWRVPTLAPCTAFSRGGSFLTDAHFTPHRSTGLADVLQIPGKGYYKTVQSPDTKVMHPLIHTYRTSLRAPRPPALPTRGWGQSSLLPRGLLSSSDPAGGCQRDLPHAAELEARRRGSGRRVRGQPPRYRVAWGLGTHPQGTWPWEGERGAAACKRERPRQPHANASAAAAPTHGPSHGSLRAPHGGSPPTPATRSPARPGPRGAPTVTWPVIPVMRATFLPFISSPSPPGAAAQAHASGCGGAAILPVAAGAAQVRR